MNFDLIVDFFKGLKRQGPGSAECTKRALDLSGLSDRSDPLKIADIGCGTGASTLVLAEELDAHITAVDLFDRFLDSLTDNAEKQGLNQKIDTLTCSMDSLPFSQSSLDAIWSEGAIYNMGFEKGIRYFKPFLKTGGILAVSEITWLSKDRPIEISRYWNKNYPEIALASEKISQLEDQGFRLKGYFPLPENCWRKQYYEPMLNQMDEFLARHQTSEAEEFIAAETEEIELYKKHHHFYSYGFYVAEKIE